MTRRKDRRTRRRYGATMGTPSSSLAEAPPSVDQEANWVISGGGLAGRGPDGEPSRTVRGSRRRERVEPETRPDLAVEVLTGGAAEAETADTDEATGTAEDTGTAEETASQARVRRGFLGIGRRRG